MNTPAAVPTLTRQDTSFRFRFGQREYDLSARTHIMGVLNVTPDSFSDGGLYLEPGRAVDHALRLIDEGADLIDVGGESTRPRGQAYGAGAQTVPDETEMQRVIPVISAIAARTSVPVSIDTWKSSVARRALDAGAVVVNDISGLTFDPALASVIASHGASAVLMHIKGTPATMQMNPVYDDLIGEIRASLDASLRRGREAGISQMLVDPGIGFGKTPLHNFALIRRLRELSELGCPILIGPSRKSFLGTVLDLPVGERLEGTIAACVASILHGAHVIRVHDVKAAKRAALVADAIRSAA